jgi:hypothetical protein
LRRGDAPRRGTAGWRRGAQVAGDSVLGGSGEMRGGPTQGAVRCGAVCSHRVRLEEEYGGGAARTLASILGRRRPGAIHNPSYHRAYGLNSSGEGTCHGGSPNPVLSHAPRQRRNRNPFYQEIYSLTVLSAPHPLAPMLSCITIYTSSLRHPRLFGVQFWRRRGRAR